MLSVPYTFHVASAYPSISGGATNAFRCYSFTEVQPALMKRWTRRCGK